MGRVGLYVGTISRGDTAAASRILMEQDALAAQQRAAEAAEELVRLQREEAERRRYQSPPRSLPSGSSSSAPAKPSFVCPHCGSGMPGRYSVCAQCRRDVFWVDQLNTPFGSADLAQDAVNRLREEGKRQNESNKRGEQSHRQVVDKNIRQAKRLQAQRLVQEAFKLQSQLDEIIKKLASGGKGNSQDHENVLAAIKPTASQALERAKAFLDEADVWLQTTVGDEEINRDINALRTSKDRVGNLLNQLEDGLVSQSRSRDSSETPPTGSTGRNLVEIADSLVTLLACMASADGVASDQELSNIVLALKSTACPLTDVEIQQRAVAAAVRVVEMGVHKAAIEACVRLRQWRSKDLDRLVLTSMDLVAMANRCEEESESQLFDLILRELGITGNLPPN